MYANHLNKDLVMCGDFNVDVFKLNRQSCVGQFVNTMCSLMMYPKITKPIRVTSKSSTLIDYSYTNIMDNNIIGGILYTILVTTCPFLHCYPFPPTVLYITIMIVQ